VDKQTGNTQVRNTCGTTVIFDSLSSEEEVRRRNPVINSVSKLNDTARHFLTNMNVSVTSPVAAVLSPSTVSMYRTVDRKAKEPPVAKRSHVVTEFDLEIERRKRQCAMLFSETSAPPPKPRFMSMAEALLSMNPHQKPSSSFAHALCGESRGPTPLPSPCSSSEMVACCAVPKRHMLTPPRSRSGEEIAISALREFGNM
jgi:hypothetical protein